MKNLSIAVSLGLSAALAAHAGGLTPSRLVTPPAGPTLNDSREAVTFAWALPAEQTLSNDLPAVAATSKEYFLRVGAGELAQGIALPTTAPRALVRINPASAKNGPAVDPAGVVITSGHGESFAAGRGMELLVGEAELAAAGVPFPEGTTAFRLSAEVGSGLMRLAVPDLAAAPGAQYVVHVFEPESPVSLAVALPRGLYLHGESVSVDLSAAASGKALRLSGATAFVTSPSGRAWSLPLASAAGRLTGSLRLDAREAALGGLWEVHVAANGTLGEAAFVRNARAAFSVALPTARLSGNAQPVKDSAGLAVRVDVETAGAGRYEVRGVLYGRDARGEARPLAMADTAGWLEKGAGSLILKVPAELLRASALTAPYELRNLELVDQGRMGLLQRQDLALAAIVP